MHILLWIWNLLFHTTLAQLNKGRMARVWESLTYQLCFLIANGISFSR